VILVNCSSKRLGKSLAERWFWLGAERAPPCRPLAERHRSVAIPLSLASISPVATPRNQDRRHSRWRSASRLLPVIREPCAFGLREAFRVLSGLKAHDGLVVIDDHSDCVSRCPVGSFRGVISMLNDIRSSLLSGRHSTGIGGERGASSPVKIETETVSGRAVRS
jgi:hypothetical protein